MQEQLLLKIFILLTRKFRDLCIIIMCPPHPNYRPGINQGKVLESKCSNDITFRVEDYYHKLCYQSKQSLDLRPSDSQKTTDVEIEAFWVF